MKLFLYFFFLLDLCFSSTSQNMESMVKDGKVQSSRTIIEELIEMSIAEIQTGGEIERANTRKISLYCFKVESDYFDGFMKDLTSSIQSTLSDISRSSAEPKIKISQLVKEYKFLGEFPEFLMQGMKEDSGSNPNTSYLDNNLKSNDNTSDKDFKTEIKKLIKGNMSNNKFGLISDGCFSDFDFIEVGNVFMDYFISEKFNPEKENLNEEIKNAQIDEYDENIILKKIFNSGGITLRDPNMYDVLTLEFEILKRIDDHFNTALYENELAKRSFIKEIGLKHKCFQILKDIKKESWEFLQKYISKPTESYIVVSLSHLKKEMLIESFINSSLLNSISDKIFLACNVETINISKSIQYFCEFVDKESLASEITNYIKKTQNKNRTVETKKNNYKPGNIFSIENYMKKCIDLITSVYKNVRRNFDNIIDLILLQKTDATTENFKFEVFHRTDEYSETISKSIAVLAKDKANNPKYLIYAENNNDPLKEDNLKNIVDILNLLYKFHSKIRKQLNKALVTRVYYRYHNISCLNESSNGISFEKKIYCNYKDVQSKLLHFNNAFEKKVRDDCLNIKEFLVYKDNNRFEFIDFNDKMIENIYYFAYFGLRKLSYFDERNNNFVEEHKYTRVYVVIIFFRYEDTGNKINTFCHFEHLIFQKIDYKELFSLINDEVFKSVFTKSYGTKNHENTSHNQENRLESGDSTSDRSSYFYPTFEKWFSTINHLDPKKNIIYLI